MSDHTHDHDHHHGNADVVMLRRAFVLTTVFLVVELIAGLWTNALVLIADAGHMFLDSVALGLAWWAAHRISPKGEDERLVLWIPPLPGVDRRLCERSDSGRAGCVDCY